MPKRKKPVTTKKGQHHKFKSFMMNLVKDNDISKVDSNVLRKHKESFEKKKVTFEKRNADPEHFQEVIYREFPSINGMEFSLWRLPMNKYTLIPLPESINNAVALCNYEDLNRSVIYIRLMAAPAQAAPAQAAPGEAQDEVPDSSNFCEPDTNQDATSDDDEETEEEMDAPASTGQTVAEFIAKKRKHLSESEDRSQKRKSYSTGRKNEDIPSSSGAVPADDDHDVVGSVTQHSYGASAAVDDDDVNVSSARIDTGSEKLLIPQDTSLAQVTPVPVFDAVMSTLSTILDQCADVSTNANNAASLPIECIDNTRQEQFLNTQTTPAWYLNYLHSDSINQPGLQNRLTTNVAQDVNVSSMRNDTYSAKHFNPQDSLFTQTTSFCNPVMNYQPSTFNQFADVTTNRCTAASLPNERFDKVYEGPFIPQHPTYAQPPQPALPNILHFYSIDQPNLQHQMISSSQIQSFDSNYNNGRNSLNACNLLPHQVTDSDQFPTDAAQNMNQFPVFQNVYDLSTSGSQDSNVQLNIALNSHAGQQDMNSGDASIEVPKAELIGEFDCNLRSITGLAALDKRLYVISKNSETVKIHSSQNPFEKISDHKVKGMEEPFQIFASSKKNSLYIIDGEKSKPKSIWKATDGDEFVANRLMEDVNCCCLSETNKGDLVLLDAKNYCLHLYNSDSGRCFHCIDLSNIDRNEFGDPHFVISSLDDAFYISSANNTTRISMVYKISGDGDLLNTFGGRSGKGSGQLSVGCDHRLILDRHGRVIVLDKGNRRVLLLNSNLELMTTLLSNSYYNPEICYDDDEDRLITGKEGLFGCIMAYSISQFEPDSLMKIATQKPSKFDEGLNEAHMLGNISIKNEGFEQCNIRGVAVLLDKIYILTPSSIHIHSCLNPFKRIHLEEFGRVDFWDIAADDECDDRRLYITDKAKHCVWLMGIDLRRIEWLQNICSPYSLSVSKDGSVVIPNNREQSIDVYKGGKTAQPLLSIKLSPGLNNTVTLRHAIKVQEHYVVCHGCIREDFADVNDDYVPNKVLLVSTNGRILRSFECLFNGDILRPFECLSTSTKLNLPNHLAVDREGGIIVADSKNKRVVRLNGKLELEKTLLSNEAEGIDEAHRLSYDRKKDQLFICHSQSLAIFSFSLDLSKRVINPKLSPGIMSLNSRQDVWSCDFLEFQKINEVDAQTMKYKDKRCRGVAVLHERLYLLLFYDKVVTVCVHRSDPPFDLIDEVQIEGQDGFMDGYFYRCTDIVASSTHDRCYIKNYVKIWYLLDGNQRAEEFLESERYIRSMSVTAEGQLLVVYVGGKLATYNSNGECTECIFLNDNDATPKYGVKTGEGKFIYAALDMGCLLKGIYERSVDGIDCCFYGPFDAPTCPYECKAMTLGEDGQVFILCDNGEVLSYDYKRHLLSIRLTEGVHKMSKVTGFCYSKEKKQLLICGNEGIAFLQILQKKQNERSCEGLKSIERKKNASKDEEIDKSSEGNKGRLLYSVDVSNFCDRSRGITRLENNTYLLSSSKLLAINSKDIQKNNCTAHSLSIPEPSSELKRGGLMDIAASHFDLCLYVTDKRNRCVWSVTIDHKVNKWLDDIDSPYTLSVTEDGSVSILDNCYKQLDVYDSNAVRKKSIRLPRFMTYLCHAVQTSSGNFVICWSKKNLAGNDDDDSKDDDDDSEDDDDDSEDDEEKHQAITESSSKSRDASESLLCEISPDGALLRRFSSSDSAPSSQLPLQPIHLAIDANDRIFVSDGHRRNRRILLFDNQLKFIENMAKDEPFEDISSRQLFYDSSTKELLVVGLYTPDDDNDHFLMCLKV